MSLESRFSALERLGWSSTWESAFHPFGEQGLAPARVAREDLGRYLVLDLGDERIAEITGRFRHEARTGADLPAVGDWVALRRNDDGPSRIEAVLPRRTAFTRKVPGSATEEQVVASNLDTVFLVVGLDGNFNPRRIERYLTAAWESGANPVVVLNKADLCEDLADCVSQAESVAMGVPVVVTSSVQTEAGNEPARALEAWLSPGSTVALLGSSGVGKSTLVNVLLGAERLETGAVRSVDSKGRHTTTRRELVVLPSGALLLDTPGMRELQLWGEDSGLENAFPEIVALGGECRFRDCRHRTEPGCAVLAAVESGAIEEERLEAWRKLERELAYLERRRDVRAMAEEKARWKRISQSARAYSKERGRG